MQPASCTTPTAATRYASWNTHRTQPASAGRSSHKPPRQSELSPRPTKPVSAPAPATSGASRVGSRPRGPPRSLDRHATARLHVSLAAMQPARPQHRRRDQAHMHASPQGPRDPAACGRDGDRQPRAGSRPLCSIQTYSPRPARSHTLTRPGCSFATMMTQDLSVVTAEPPCDESVHDDSRPPPTIPLGQEHYSVAGIGRRRLRHARDRPRNRTCFRVGTRPPRPVVTCPAWRGKDALRHVRDAFAGNAEVRPR